MLRYSLPAYLAGWLTLSIRHEASEACVQDGQEFFKLLLTLLESKLKGSANKVG